MKNKKCFLGDVAEFVMGQAPPGKTCNKNGIGDPFIKAGEFSSNGPIIREWTTDPKKFAKNGDVLICVVGATSGKINRGINCSIGRSVAAIRPNPSHIDSGYLFYLMKSKVRQLRDKSQGMAQGVITNKMLRELNISLPPLYEQQQIAKILDIISHLEDLHNKRNLHLNSFIDSLFNFYFGDLLTNSKSFKQRNFEDIVYFQEGPGIRKWQFRDTGIKLVNVKNIVNGELDINNTSRYLDESEVNKKYKHFLLDEGDLVMSSSGVTWGKIAYVESNDLPLCLNTSIIRLKPKSKEIRHSFIFYFIQSRAFKSQIKKLITGSAQPNFGPSHLKQIRCPLPSLSKQLEFEIFLKKYTKMYSYCKQIRNREEEFSLSTVNNLL